MASPNTRKTSDIAPNELYSTPLIALEKFYEQYPEVIDQYEVFYDPCDGLGVISHFLRGLGKKVYTADIYDYGIGVGTVQDFLETESIPEYVDCIIFNPPFTLTEKFVDKALQLCPNLLMFNRMTTIESNSRAEKFDKSIWSLRCMYQFGFRVSCSKGVNQEPTANSVAYAFFEFDKWDDREPNLRWITK